MPKLCLLIAVLILSGCSAVMPLSRLHAPLYPPLDASLAADCRLPDVSPVADYDEWDKENADILAALADCAVRHHQTVKAWPK